MKKRLISTVLSACLLSSPALMQARPVPAKPQEFTPLRTIYVAPTGDDAADGLAESSALRTISAAARLVRPGDLVLVSGGEYAEHVYLNTAGTAENPIVFRARKGETALVTGARRIKGWRASSQATSVYETDCPLIPNELMDENFMIRYIQAPGAAALRETPGSYIYDEETGTLSVHTFRGLSPDQSSIVLLGYTTAGGDPAGPGERGEEYSKGFWLNAGYNRVEGFDVAFHVFGMRLSADHVEVRGNRVYGSIYMGIQVQRGTGAVVANNIAFLNEGSGVHLSAASKGATVLGNIAWGNTPKGPFIPRSMGGFAYQMALYGSATDPTVEGNLYISGSHPFERRRSPLRFKTAKGIVAMRNNTLVGGTALSGWGERSTHEFNTVVGGVMRTYSAPSELITPENAAGANSTASGNLYLDSAKDAAFADPARLDYRLRADSPNLGEGAWPNEERIVYTGTQGDDTNSGESPEKPLKTIAAAVNAAGPGGTVYVLPGEYSETIGISTVSREDQPLEILTYGRGEAVLKGGEDLKSAFIIESARNVVIDGFVFRDFPEAAISSANCSGLRLENNVFDSLDKAVNLAAGADIRVENCTFDRNAVGVEAAEVSGGLVLRNNLSAGGGELLKADPASEAALISERNAFAGEGASARLQAWEARATEAHPSLAIESLRLEPGYALPPHSRHAFAGVGHKPLGARTALADTSDIDIDDFRAVYLSKDRVVLEWYTPRDYANASLKWDADGKNAGRASINQYLSGSVLRHTRLRHTLSDLQPGAEYTAELKVSTRDGRANSKTLTFATPTENMPAVTLHVSPQGSDSNDGLRPDSALATITAATRKAGAGSTILVHPGVYKETVELTCGGISAEKPLVMRSAVPREAVIDVEGIRDAAFVLDQVGDVLLDGFSIRGLTYGSARRAVWITDSENIEIANFFFEKHRGNTMGTTCRLIAAHRVKGIYLHHNLFQRGFYNVSLGNVEDVVIDHNTFYKGGVTAIHIATALDANIKITNNIFYDVIAHFKVNPAVAVSRPSANLTLQNNMYWRDKARNMGLFGYLSTRDGEYVSWSERAFTVEEVRERYGIGEGDRVEDPLFENADEDDFRLKTGSPASGAGSDGEDLGM